MTGSAKQSMRQQGSKSGLLRCARNDVALIPHTFAISPRDAREFFSKVPPSSVRGHRECRAPDAPAALRAKVESTQAGHHGHAGSPGIPRAREFLAAKYLSKSIGLGVSIHRCVSIRRSPYDPQKSPPTGRSLAPQPKAGRLCVRHVGPGPRNSVPGRIPDRAGPLARFYVIFKPHHYFCSVAWTILSRTSKNAGSCVSST
jgi:hypothetical protein